MNNSKVYVKKCNSYDEAKLYPIIKDILGKKFVYSDQNKNKKILVNPNILSDRPLEAGVNTHPIFIKVVVCVLKEFGYDVYVGDGPGAGEKKVRDVYEKSGIQDAVSSAGGSMIVFEQGVKIDLDKSFYKKELLLYKDIFDFDHIISLPKFKTHGLMLFTGGIKNLYGLVCGLTKVEYHREAPLPKEFAKIVVDIYLAIKPSFTLIDGIVGMDGEGPANGRIRDIGVVVGSESGIAADTLCSKIMNIDPMEIPANREAYKRGIKEAVFSGIEVEGTYPVLKDFEFSRTTLLMFEKMPLFIAKFLVSLVWMRPHIVLEKCRLCGKCANGCPIDCISKVDNGYLIDKGKCIKCLCCHEFCPYSAIKIEKSLLLRVMPVVKKSISMVLSFFSKGFRKK